MILSSNNKVDHDDESFDSDLEEGEEEDELGELRWREILKELGAGGNLFDPDSEGDLDEELENGDNISLDESETIEQSGRQVAEDLDEELENADIDIPLVESEILEQSYVEVAENLDEELENTDSDFPPDESETLEQSGLEVAEDLYEELENADFDFPPDKSENPEQSGLDVADDLDEELENADIDFPPDESETLEQAQPEQPGLEIDDDWLPDVTRTSSFDQSYVEKTNGSQPKHQPKLNLSIPKYELRKLKHKNSDVSYLDKFKESPISDFIKTSLQPLEGPVQPEVEHSVPEPQKIANESQPKNSSKLCPNSSFNFEHPVKLKIMETTMERELFGNLLITAVKLSINLKMSQTAKAIKLYL